MSEALTTVRTVIILTLKSAKSKKKTNIPMLDEEMSHTRKINHSSPPLSWDYLPNFTVLMELWSADLALSAISFFALFALRSVRSVSMVI